MLDIGWPEFLFIVVIAIIVIGPKDLPKALHTVGKWVRKVRSISREFQSGVDQMVREAELDDLRKQANEVRSLNVKRELEKAIDPDDDLKFSIDPTATSGSVADKPASGSPSGGSRDETAVAPASPKPDAQQTAPAGAPVAATAPPREADNVKA